MYAQIIRNKSFVIMLISKDHNMEVHNTVKQTKILGPGDGPQVSMYTAAHQVTRWREEY